MFEIELRYVEDKVSSLILFFFVEFVLIFFVEFVLVESDVFLYIDAYSDSSKSITSIHSSFFTNTSNVIPGAAPSRSSAAWRGWFL